MTELGKGRTKSKAERLEVTNYHARKAGMTYGQYQQRKYISEHPANRDKLKDMQPVYMQTTDEYLCPKCAAPLTPYRNCGKCGKVIIWRKGVRG